MRLRQCLICLAAIAALVTDLRAQDDATDVPPPPPPAVARASAVEPTRVLQHSGLVLRTKQVDDLTANEKVLVAQLELGNGEQQIVDLGPTRIYAHAPVRTGEQIVVYGPEVRLGNARVILATEVHVGAEKIVVPRAGAAPRAGYFVSGPDVKLYGRIEALRPARLRDSRVEHWIARIVDQIGNPTIVDMGPKAALWRADLRADDWVTVYGPYMHVGNGRVLLAREINKSGLPYLIQRQLVTEPPARTATAVERAAPIVP